MKTALLADGYAVEAFITAADLDLTSWTPASFGFDLAVDVSAPSGTPNLKCGLQLGQYFLHVPTRLTLATASHGATPVRSAPRRFESVFHGALGASPDLFTSTTSPSRYSDQSARPHSS